MLLRSRGLATPATMSALPLPVAHCNLIPQVVDNGYEHHHARRLTFAPFGGLFEKLYPKYFQWPAGSEMTSVDT